MASKPRLSLCVEPGSQRQKAPQTENDTWDRRQKFCNEGQWDAQSTGAKIRQENGGSNANRHRKNQREDGGHDRPENSRSNAIAVMNRVKRLIGQKTPPELLKRRNGTIDQNHHDPGDDANHDEHKQQGQTTEDHITQTALRASWELHHAGRSCQSLLHMIPPSFLHEIRDNFLSFLANPFPLIRTK